MSALAVPRLDLGTVGVGLGLGAVAAIALYFALKNAGALGEFAGKAAGDAVGGVVLGVGDSLGIPRTNVDACELALAEGRTWDASFVCPAGRFIGSLFAGDPRPAPASRSPYDINPRDRT